jgi:hypothetical protein
VYTLELSADSVGKSGAVSEEWTARTAAQSAGMAERDTGTAVEGPIRRQERGGVNGSR